MTGSSRSGGAASPSGGARAWRVLLAPLRLADHAVRVALYFLLYLPIFAWFELALRLATRHRPGGDESRRRARINDLIRQWGWVLCELTLRLLRAHLTVEGEIPEGRFVVVANHQSTADISILLWVFASKNCKFVAKRELGRGKPVVSLAVREGGFALVDREFATRDLVALREMGQGLADWDGCAIVFAEGSRSRDGGVAPYRSAAVHVVARSAELPLLPVAIDGTWAAADLPGFVKHMPRARLRVTLGEVIPVADRPEGVAQQLEDIRRWTVRTLERHRLEEATPRPEGWEPGTDD